MVDSKTIRSRSLFHPLPSPLPRGSPSLIRLPIRRRGLHAKVLLLNNMMSTSKSHRSHQRRSTTSGLLPQRKAYSCWSSDAQELTGTNREKFKRNVTKDKKPTMSRLISWRKLTSWTNAFSSLLYLNMPNCTHYSSSSAKQLVLSGGRSTLKKSSRGAHSATLKTESLGSTPASIMVLSNSNLMWILTRNQPTRN